MSQVGNKVKSMFEIVFDPTQEKEKREKGADNLVRKQLKLYLRNV